MLEAKVVDAIQADIESVWAELGNFSGIKAGPGIDSVDYEGEGEGMTRSINMSNGSVVERLDVHDSGEKVFTYSIINEDSPLPFSGYSATVCLANNGDGSTAVDWTGSFDASLSIYGSSEPYLSICSFI